jgi:hypothetical protein
LQHPLIIERGLKRRVILNPPDIQRILNAGLALTGCFLREFGTFARVLSRRDNLKGAFTAHFAGSSAGYSGRLCLCSNSAERVPP